MSSNQMDSRCHPGRLHRATSQIELNPAQQSVKNYQKINGLVQAKIYRNILRVNKSEQLIEVVILSLLEIQFLLIFFKITSLAPEQT